MEAIGVIILIWIGWAIVSSVISAGARTAGAAGKAALGKGTFSENMDMAFNGMGEFEAQLVDTFLGDDDSGPKFKAVQCKGLIPVSRKTELGVMISAFDSTGEDWKPLLSSLDNFQEDSSIVFQHFSELTIADANQGYGSWVQVGAFIPDIVQPPFGGQREISVLVRLVDMNDLPSVRHGFHDPDACSGIVWQKSLSFTHFFEEKGYEEEAENRDEAAAISVKIGMAVAMADGSLDDAEGKVLQSWIQKVIEPFSDSKKSELKKVYNKAMRDSYQDAANGDLVLSELTSRLHEIGEKASKYETIELCFEVMAADGIADAEELQTIHKIADALDLDFDEVSRMREQKVVTLDASVSSADGVNSLLGIDPSWSKDQIRRHLRTEFQKWNNRLNTLQEGDERNNAQRMLEAIAEARKVYA